MGYTNIIQPYLDSFSGYASLAYYDFRTNQTFLHHATTTMRSASLIKLPILSYALTQVAKGQLDLSQRITLKQTMQVAGAGILHALQEGVTLSLQDLLTLMIIVSDNSATNILIELLGQANINQFIQDLGLQQTELIAKLQLAKEKQNEKNDIKMTKKLMPTEFNQTKKIIQRRHRRRCQTFPLLRHNFRTPCCLR